jgi:signal recognition particle subunit SEC65
MPDMNNMFDEIEEEQNNSTKELNNNNKKKASQAQKNAAEKLKQAAEKLQKAMSGMEMSMMQENLDDLRDIVHNLLTLSFNQESLMNEFRAVDQSDPRFVQLSQKQVQLKEDATIVKDSLESLAKRVFQIETFITREINDMNNSMNESADAIKERKKELAVSKQQFAMTSMNNLALLLDDVLQQMQQQMADAMGQAKPGDKNQKNMPGLSELQKELNDKIKDLKESGKQGRQLSEELAKLAAEQERIRKALQEAQKKYENNNEENSPGNGITKKMEETELDLVNKKITQETLQRQKEIMTRLLEAENAMRKDEMEETRESQTAKETDTIIPKEFEEYFKMKEKEVELLKTVPPKIYPYYKKEINDYFKRLGNFNSSNNEYNQN